MRPAVPPPFGQQRVAMILTHANHSFVNACRASPSKRFCVADCEAGQLHCKPLKGASSAGCGKLAPALVPRPLWFPEFFLQIARKQRADERTRTAYPCSSYEFA